MTGDPAGPVEPVEPVEPRAASVNPPEVTDVGVGPADDAGDGVDPADGTDPGTDPVTEPAEVVHRLRRRGETLAVAESLTGGLLAAAVVDVPGASAVFRGGLVAYATDLKESLAGVPADLLARYGPVDPRVAIALAVGARDRCGADWGLATTGVAGPDPGDGAPVGTVYVACAGPSGRPRVRSRGFAGDRRAVREAAVRAALALLTAEG